MPFNFSTTLISLLFISLHLPAEDPWGKDSNLTSKAPCSPPSSFGISSISFFQEIISPIDGIRSCYRPSSSQYMKDAIYAYGFSQGIALGCDRLLRENGDEWYYRSIEWQSFTFKYDPVNPCYPCLP
ncbi:MAG: membrane protein insertion efficiency factor YidD [Chlamydiota bacterium]